VEGPSLHLAAEVLQPFVGRRILAVDGNSRIGIERLRRRTVRDLFSWGKHLVFQFDGFALRVHFLLWGTFAAVVRGQSVTGDYRRTSNPRLVMTFANGEITMWSASLRFVDDPQVRSAYDFTSDVLSSSWNAGAALAKLRRHPRAEIADVLLDQDIFAGVGNIIKNEVLFRVRVHPLSKVGALPAGKLRELVDQARQYSFDFYEWKKQYVLRKHWLAHTKRTCPRCNIPFLKAHLGVTNRRSFYCENCQVRYE